MDARIRQLAERIWNYHQLHHQLRRADVILVLCSHDTSVAARGAELWLDGWAPRLVFSGGLGGITKKMWTEPEADRFARIAIEMGVPADRILIENQSTNTGENVRFTRRLLEENGIDPARLIVVQKPYMERRSYATFHKVWPGKDVIVTSPQVGVRRLSGAVFPRARCRPTTSSASWSATCSASVCIRRRAFRSCRRFRTTCGPRSRNWSPSATTST